jgi:hypothetical protein
MNIFNYLFIGFVFTLLMDILMGILKNKKLLPEKVEWDWNNRVLCIIVWPLAGAWFFIAFFKAYFKQ